MITIGCTPPPLGFCTPERWRGSTSFKKKFCIEKIFGSGALSDKMLLVRIIENIKIDAYFNQVRPAVLGKGLPNMVRDTCNC